MKKQKLTLQEKLAKRKFKIQNRFLYRIYKFIMVDLVSKKYHMHYRIVDDINEEKGACVVIFNHLSRIDHSYVLGATYPKRHNMLAAYSEFFRSHLALVFRLNQVIPKKQYYNDVQSIKGMTSILRQGGCVAFAPEGLCSNYGSNKPIVPGTGKMLKHFGVPVYFCKLEGVYLQNTKVCLDERYGETYCTLTKLFTPEDLKAKTGDEIDDIINEKFRHDDYAWQKEKRIKWKTHGRICEHLEDFCYKCPTCGTEFEMEGKGDKIVCKHCGHGARMNDYYEFLPFEGSVIPESPLAWVEQERKDIIDEIRADEHYSYSERVKIGNLPKYHTVRKKGTSELTGEGLLTVDHKGMHYDGTRYGEPFRFDLSYRELYTLITEQDASFFNLYVNGEYFDIFPQERRSVGKIYLLVEEMHRLHVNFYKNFKWFDDLYEGKPLGIDNLTK